MNSNGAEHWGCLRNVFIHAMLVLNNAYVLAQQNLNGIAKLILKLSWFAV